MLRTCKEYSVSFNLCHLRKPNRLRCGWLKSEKNTFLNMLAETATKDIANASNPQGLKENKKVAKRGGNVAKVAKETLEQETGKPVITTKNAIDFGRLISDVTKEIPD